MGLVLFVCGENTFRSVMAEAIFNDRTPAGWHAESAGVQAATAINPLVVPLLREIGIEVGPKVPRLVSAADIAAATRVVTFGCLDRCPAGAAAKSEDWPLPSATGKMPEELQAIRDAMVKRVEDLISRIKSQGPAWSSPAKR